MEWMCKKKGEMKANYEREESGLMKTVEGKAVKRKMMPGRREKERKKG